MRAVSRWPSRDAAADQAGSLVRQRVGAGRQQHGDRGGGYQSGDGGDEPEPVPADGEHRDEAGRKRDPCTSAEREEERRQEQRQDRRGPARPCALGTRGQSEREQRAHRAEEARARSSSRPARASRYPAIGSNEPSRSGNRRVPGRNRRRSRFRRVYRRGAGLLTRAGIRSRASACGEVDDQTLHLLHRPWDAFRPEHESAVQPTTAARVPRKSRSGRESTIGLGGEGTSPPRGPRPQPSPTRSGSSRRSPGDTRHGGDTGRGRGQAPYVSGQADALAGEHCVRLSDHRPSRAAGGRVRARTVCW